MNLDLLAINTNVIIMTALVLIVILMLYISFSLSGSKKIPGNIHGKAVPH